MEQAGLIRDPAETASEMTARVLRAYAVDAGAIHITFGNRANAAIAGKTLSLRPAVVDDAPVVPVAWVCAGASAPQKMTLRGDNRTTVPARFLPLNCR